MRWLRYLILLTWALDAWAIDFERDIQPIFTARCFECHDSEARRGGVSLDRFFYAHQPTDSGEPLFIEGNAESSLLVKVLESTDPEHRMPAKGDPLSEREISQIRAWIDVGASWPDDGWRPPKHWAYETPSLPPVPQSSSSWPGNAIDRFIEGQLVKRGLLPQSNAAPASLLRRVSLDLTGLPPSVEQIDTFLEDPSDEAYQRFVDTFLASKSFGERWARQWLDLARYADSEGYQRDELRSLWAWRDWVIAALNADMPFDQFTVEQIAGDLLPNATPSQVIATGFQRNTPVNLEAGTDPHEDRHKQVVDRVNTLGTVWLGTTLACAQCHHHKYDPLSIREYYELFAFFNQSPIETKQQGMQMGMSNMVYIGPNVEVPQYPGETTRVMQTVAKPRATFIAKRGDFLSQGAEVEARIPAIWPGLPEGAPANRLGLARWLVREDHPLVPRVFMNRLWAELFGRGLVTTLEEFGSQGSAPTHPALLDWLAVTFVKEDAWSLKKALRRLVLSRTYRQSAAVRPDAMTADPSNNLYWRHPGQRLDAETLRDQGLYVSGLLSHKLGGPPVYPFQPDGVWRKTIGAGPEEWVQSEGEDQYRRGVYTIWKRNGHYASFAMFDAPDRGVCTVNRARSNTPLQALTLLNDRAFVEMTRAFAQRMLHEFSGDATARLTRAFRTVLARHPTTKELKGLEHSLKAAPNRKEGFEDVAAILFNLHETLHR